MSDAVAHQFFFDGVKRGILFGVEWNTLSTAINRLKKKVITFEEDFVDPLAHRLGPQLHSLAQQINIEYNELADLMNDENGVNRETEFESILYNFSVFKIKLKTIQKLHNARLKKVKKRAIKAKKNKQFVSL